MKKVLLAGVAAASLLTAGSAFAADLPSRKYAPVAPAVVVPVFTWTGFYVGVNAGYGWNSQGNNDVYYGGLAYSGTNSSNNGGFVGGAQAGYNYQIGSFVVGAEADIQYAGLKGSNNNYSYVVLPTLGYVGVANNGVEWYGTVRARAGFAFDRALIYATGGFAYGGGGSNGGYYYNGFYYGAGDNTRTGWTVGAGVEYAFTNNIIGRVEGAYVNLGHSNSNTYLIPGLYGSSKDTEFGVVRVGLNYKF